MTIKFKDRVVDLDGKFESNPVSGDLKIKTNKEAIFQHIELLLMQEEDSLIGRPGVCAGLNSLIFEQFGVHESNVLKAKIRNTLRFEPRIQVLDIEVLQNNHDVDIRIEFEFFETRKKYTYESTLRRVL